MTAPDADTTRLVAQLGDALGQATAPTTLTQELRSTVARVRQVYAAAACSFAQVDPDGGTLRFVAADGAGADAIVGVTMPVSRGIAGWVVMSGEPIRIADVGSDTRFARDVAEATDYVPTTILAAPVVDDHGVTSGVIEVLDPGEGTGSSGSDLAMLGLVAAQVSAVFRLSSRYDALGAGLLRTLADPDDSGAFDDALLGLAESGTSLRDLAEVFRTLAGQGPEAARLAQSILEAVVTFATARGAGHRGGLR